VRILPEAAALQGNLEARMPPGQGAMADIVSFPRMPDSPDHRRGPDRRRAHRGGRRALDQPGFAPLVMLVGDNGESCEAILAKLRFAVAPTRTADEALRVMTGLNPDLIVAREPDAARLRGEAPQHVPVVVLNDQTADPDVLVAEIRKALRAKNP
jgi:hypothetical protein